MSYKKRLPLLLSNGNLFNVYYFFFILYTFSLYSILYSLYFILYSNFILLVLYTTYTLAIYKEMPNS